MGEALISRAGGGTVESEVEIPITPGYHSILITVKDATGTILSNWPVSCKDGASIYNYNTNEKGQSLFMCNSGSANIWINNYKGGVHYLDITGAWSNVDAPVGLSSRLNINIENGANSYDFTSAKSFSFIHNRMCNLNIVGGGGGGGYGSSGRDSGGGGGGAGYMNNYANQQLTANTLYSFVAGSGGSGSSSWSSNASSGGTSYIANTGYSAIGGSFGENGDNGASGGKGGLGNGGRGDWDPDKGEDSPVTFAGGGGSGGAHMTVAGKSGGSPYGGRGGNYYTSGTAGSRGGGGGGGGASPTNEWPGGRGGGGMMRIQFSY